MLTTVIGLAEPAAEAEGPSPLAPHLAKIIFALVFLALLWVVFDRVVSPRFEKAYAERTKAIEGGMNEAKQAQAEAKAALDQYNAQLAEAGRTQAVAQLRTEVGTLATGLAGRIVGESLEDEARQRRTVERFLAEIEGAQPVGTDS